MKKTALLAFAVLLLCPALSADAAGGRAFSALTDKELDGLSTISRNYFLCVSKGLGNITTADDSTPERILATYPPYIKMQRQECRVNLVLIEKYLYGLDLNPEFIHNYSNALRDDVVYFALSEKLKQKRTAGDEAAEEAAEQKRRLSFDAQHNATRNNGTEKRTVIPGITPPSER